MTAAVAGSINSIRLTRPDAHTPAQKFPNTAIAIAPAPRSGASRGAITAAALLRRGTDRCLSQPHLAIEGALEKRRDTRAVTWSVQEIGTAVFGAFSDPQFF